MKQIINVENHSIETKTENMKLEFDSYSHNESFARVVVSAFMARLDPTIEELEDVKTAVSEAVTNAIIHGYKNTYGVIQLCATIKENTITIIIKDYGVGIENVKQAMEPLYTGEKESERCGMGFAFMEAFMDEIEVISKVNEGTTIIMKKTIGNRVV